MCSINIILFLPCWSPLLLIQFFFFFFGCVLNRVSPPMLVLIYTITAALLGVSLCNDITHSYKASSDSPLIGLPVNRKAAFQKAGESYVIVCVCVCVHCGGRKGCRVSHAAPFSSSLSGNIICAFSDSPGSYAACKFISLIIRAGDCPGGLMASFLMHPQPPGPLGYYPPLTWKNCVSSTEKTPGYLSCSTI